MKQSSIEEMSHEDMQSNTNADMSNNDATVSAQTHYRMACRYVQQMKL